MLKVCINRPTGGKRRGGHLTHFSFTGIPGVEISALSDPNPEAENNYHLTGAKKLYTSFEEMITAENPDIVLLQEIKAEFNSFPFFDLQVCGYEAKILGQKSYNGVAILAKKLFKTKLVFVAYDVYPEIGYASKSITKGNLIDKVMNAINRSLYKNADKVVALTDEMKQFLLDNREGLAPENVVTIANWASEKSVEKSDEAYEHFGYTKDQFIVSYFGNMGTCQDIDTLLCTAKLMQQDDRVRFLMVGHGNKKESAKKYITENNLSNVQLLDYLTGEDFKQAVSITSGFVVSLEKGLKGTCAPSKYYSYLQGGHPVIAIVEEDSYLAKEVENEKIGFYIPVGDAEGLKKQIESFCEQPQECENMGKRARTLYLEKYDKPIAMRKYEKLILETVRGREANE